METPKARQYRRGRYSQNPDPTALHPDLKQAMLRELGSCKTCRRAEIIAKYAALARQRS